MVRRWRKWLWLVLHWHNQTSFSISLCSQVFIAVINVKIRCELISTLLSFCPLLSPMSSKRPATWILVCGCWGSLVPWVDVPDFTQPSPALQSHGLSLSLCHLCPLTWEPLYLAPGTRCPEGWKAWKVTRQGRQWKLISNIPVDYHPLLQHANNLKWLM